MQELKLNILMIEDDPDDVDFYKTALDEHGVSYTLHAFYLPSQALSHLSQSSSLPHLIVLDLNLPAAAGPDVLASIKSDERLREVPVMVLTGSSQPEDRELSLKLGATSFYTKPVHFEEMRNIADATLRTLDSHVAA
jgi:DNA-binding response OmpR family regulator